jgi:hypothetical protein
MHRAEHQPGPRRLRPLRIACADLDRAKVVLLQFVPGLDDGHGAPVPARVGHPVEPTH